MHSDIQLLEKEIKKVRARIFYAEIVIWIDTLVTIVLLDLLLLSAPETIYIPHEYKMRMAILFLIGFIRITVVSVAKDAHFVEDLKLKETKYEKANKC